MAKNKISEWSSTPANNTDVGGIDIAEGCAPSGINNGIREMMAQIKDMQSGLDGDNFTVGGNLSVTGTSTFTGLVTLASLATTGSTTIGDAAGDVLTITGTAVTLPNGLNFDSNTLVIDATNNRVGIAKASPTTALDVTGTVTATAFAGAVGATTPSTGAFTTLTTTGNVTIGDASTDTLTVNATPTFNVAIPLTSGGTGATSASAARTSLGLGTIATQDANSVTITGGSITGITDLAVADGGTGSSTLAANAVLLGNGTSALQTVAPSTSGNVLTSNGTTWTSAANNKLTAATAQASTSGTSIDFTSIPSWVKRITVMFNGVSTSGTSIPLVQIGAGSVTTTGYLSYGSVFDTAVATTSSSTGFLIYSNTAAALLYGNMILTNISGNTWVCSGNVAIGTTRGSVFGGTLTLSATLDRLRITTTNGTDTFDAGSINIMYE